MKKGRYQSAQKAPNKILPIAATCVLLLLIGVIAFFFDSNQGSVYTPSGEQFTQQENVEKNEDSIAIPGYEAITLTADTKVQTIGFPNPAANTCYFQISLYLEDETLLWQSELVEPNAISDPIVLNQPLAAGSYPNATLKYDCYTMDGTMKQLNGAATKLTLWVKEA